MDDTSSLQKSRDTARAIKLFRKGLKADPCPTPLVKVQRNVEAAIIASHRTLKQLKALRVELLRLEPANTPEK
jgi:hypothetical protein